ncbi:MAG: hypothetical protein A49_11940 [Methyloceanibacter sp.]|nr:MAG: hypothetical protein A49_11940 [Methyloceanibacter sp.]
MPKPPKGMFKKGPSWYFRNRSRGRDQWINLGRDFQGACRRYRELRGQELPETRLTVVQAAQSWLQGYVRVSRNTKTNRWLQPESECI